MFAVKKQKKELEIEKALEKNGQSFRKGFSLIEALVSLFVFSILVTVIAGVYVEFLDAQYQAKSLQKRLENLQLASNLISKTTRTSKLAHPATGQGSSLDLVVFDYSRPLGEGCLKFSLASGTITYSFSSDNEGTCSGSSTFSAPISLTDPTFQVSGSFYYKHPVPGVSVGLVVSSFQACDVQGGSCTAVSGSSTKVQSATSIRQ